MQTFDKTITVTKNDLDVRNHVNNIRYVKWVQDIAEKHWITKTSTLIREQYYWVMLNHNITYIAEAVLGEELLLKTYVTKAEGVRTIRMVEIYNKNTNKLLTTSQTTWCLMAHKTHKPARITQEISALFN